MDLHEFTWEPSTCLHMHGKAHCKGVLQSHGGELGRGAEMGS